MAGIMLDSGTPSLCSLVRNYVFEGTNDFGLFQSTQQLYDFINIAHRKLYNEMATLAPTLLAKRSADLTTDATGALDISGTTVDTDGVLIVAGVWFKTNGQYYWLRDEDEIERDWPGNVGTPTGVLPRVWVLEGNTIRLNPELSSASTVRLLYVPGTPLLAAANYPFGGNYQQFHELVALYAATRALEKDGASKFLEGRLQKELDDFKTWCLRRKRQKGRHVLLTEMDDSYWP